MTDLREEIIEKISDRNELITAEKDFMAPDELFLRIIENFRAYRPNDDIGKIVEAYTLAKQAHGDQRRKSGEPYIVHPISVALILSELEMDRDSIIAGILHDVVEDTSIPLETVEARFGEDVAWLVNGVTKLTKISWEGGKEEQQAENLRKMFLATAEDIRVVVIKLADRTHNMRTLQFMRPEKQKEKAEETLQIFSPIADRLGISRIKVELDNLSLAYMEPEQYKKLVEDIDRKKGARENYIESIVDDVREKIASAHINADVYGRVKHYFSIYKKMVTQQKSVDEIYDIFAIRIIVDTIPDCYAALGVIHEMYTPVAGRFKDYVATPKPNNYQSIHTTLIGRDGVPFEIQIRTKEMHRVAEYGIAAHWKYKEGGKSGVSTDEEKFSWLRQILELQKEAKDDKEFLSSVKNEFNLYTDSVYCYTPSGDVKVLPAGSTPIDFAYYVHSAVGNKMIGARVNARIVNIDYQLKTGDRVEIITSQNSKGPSMDWLKICKTAQAKNKINQWFRSHNKEENVTKGKEALENHCKGMGVEFSELTKPEYIEAVLRKYGFHDWNSLVAAVGHGSVKEGQVINRLVDAKNKREKKVVTDEEVLSAIAENKKTIRRSSNGVLVDGFSDMPIHMARCCNPIPGDEIVGFITRGRGISVHRTDCVNLINLNETDRARKIDAEWDVFGDDTGKFLVQITLYLENRKGLLADITVTFAENDIAITSLRTQTAKSGVASTIIDFETKGQEEISLLMKKLRQIKGVIDIERTTG